MWWRNLRWWRTRATTVAVCNADATQVRLDVCVCGDNQGRLGLGNAGCRCCARDTSIFGIVVIDARVRPNRLLGGSVLVLFLPYGGSDTAASSTVLSILSSSGS